MYTLTPEAGVPDFICAQPKIITDALGTDPRMSMADAAAKAVTYVQANVQLYDEHALQPDTALETHTGNCFARASLLHGIHSVLPHLLSGMVVIGGEHTHAYNVLVERQGLRGVVINNSRDYDFETNSTIGYFYRPTFHFTTGSPEATAHNLDHSLIVYANMFRTASRGIARLWCARREASHSVQIPDIFPQRPSAAVQTTYKDVLRFGIFLGTAATDLVNSISGHNPLKTNAAAQDVRQELACLRNIEYRVPTRR